VQSRSLATPLHPAASCGTGFTRGKQAAFSLVQREFRCTRWRVPPSLVVALGSCFRGSAGVLVRSAFSEVERQQILDVVIWWAPRQFGEDVAGAVDIFVGEHEDGMVQKRRELLLLPSPRGEPTRASAWDTLSRS
jgi:hypothetical protein